MIKIGITGINGFIGTHLYNFLRLNKEVEIIPFNRSFFDNEKYESLKNFVSQCDVIVHLAGLNRHQDTTVIHETNISLVEKLIDAMVKENTVPHVIYSSSTQEEKDNPYGNSKKAGRKLFAKWASENDAPFTGLIIPNVFGPFGKPHYNSVIATFCYQLTHNETPKINADGNLQLIYVDELVKIIWSVIVDHRSDTEYVVPFTYEIKVSDILKLLSGFKETYFNNSIFPSFANRFELNLFNTFRSYIDHEKYFPIYLKKNADNRGCFVEAVKALTGGQFSFSTTQAGITRGNHFHTRKIERFCVISGKATIELRKTGTGDILKFDLDGEEPSFVDMPIWFTHNITNTGKDDLVTLFWINEFFDPDDPDTFYEDVKLITNK